MNSATTIRKQLQVYNYWQGEECNSQLDRKYDKWSSIT